MVRILLPPASSLLRTRLTRSGGSARMAKALGLVLLAIALDAVWRRPVTIDVSGEALSPVMRRFGRGPSSTVAAPRTVRSCAPASLTRSAWRYFPRWTAPRARPCVFDSRDEDAGTAAPVCAMSLGVLFHDRIVARFNTTSGPFQITKPPMDKHPRGFVQATVLKTISEHPQGMTSGEITKALGRQGIDQRSTRR